MTIQINNVELIEKEGIFIIYFAGEIVGQTRNEFMAKDIFRSFVLESE